MKSREPGPSGLVIVDKPAGMTSHDVVSRIRRLAGTRRVGHAGTLDPMATGVLVIGVERATRLLTYLVGADKAYAATMRLGIGTITDDAEGTPSSMPGQAPLGRAEVDLAAEFLRGQIQQVPSSVSAIKKDGKRAYTRVREGEDVQLEARPVTVSELSVLAVRPAEQDGTPVLDVDVHVVCSSGTYIRALARDLGAALGSAGHLTALRRTRVGPYLLDGAHTLPELEESFALLPIAEAARAAFTGRDLTQDEARKLAHGQRLEASELGPGPVAAYAPDGSLVALIADAGLTARPLVVLTG
ncbi:tRNA pseudouridine(55) synthase TruB [Kineosporia sp. NBRC 101731]|uniref:tRNA pseudouridine(55) synthase TruB n=1 Tax=Kineosporia sp. NBRC 101731 TaxID=3032199 RepID=UPI0024A2379B|nr:tRNA pseudouridine(55) synthase TruB [Kineosporia sp. NBRC 101731]GLY30233.1 tRNA pseudouridine synthase B [Kineosporia sp. NBRC 101731]